MCEVTRYIPFLREPQCLYTSNTLVIKRPLILGHACVPGNKVLGILSPIQRLELDNPAGAIGVLIDQARIGLERIVYSYQFTAYRGRDRTYPFTALDRSRALSLCKRPAHLLRTDRDDLPRQVLRDIGDA